MRRGRIEMVRYEGNGLEKLTLKFVSCFISKNAMMPIICVLRLQIKYHNNNNEYKIILLVLGHVSFIYKTMAY